MSGYQTYLLQYPPTNCPGTTTKDFVLTATASEPPSINSFVATPSTVQVGGSSTLSWSTTHAASVSIDNGVGNQATTASVNVAPQFTTTYTLTASDTQGISVTKSAKVTVAAATQYNLTVVSGLNVWPSYAPNAVVITHGWNSDATGWVKEMGADICQYQGAVRVEQGGSDSIARICHNSEWDVWLLDWSAQAKGLPQQAYASAMDVGEQLAILLPRNYKTIHFIAHSAGANVVDWATTTLRGISRTIQIQETFLDAYQPSGDASQYGRNADWSDNYVDMRPLIPTIPDDTNLIMTHAFNVDVTGPSSNFVLCPSPCRHSRAYRFFGLSINDNFQMSNPDTSSDEIVSTGGYGFPLSIEGGHKLAELNAAYPNGKACRMVEFFCVPTGGARSKN